MKKYDLILNTNNIICTTLDHVSSQLISSLSADGIFSQFCQSYFSPFVTSRSTPLRPSALSGVFDIYYHKILKTSPGAYIFQRPFQRGLFLEGLIYGGKNKLSFKIVRAYIWREICASKLIGLAYSFTDSRLEDVDLSKTQQCKDI